MNKYKINNFTKYEMIKEITKELKKAFKGIQANSYGHCCCSDYDTYHKYTNENDYVCCKLFKGGLNNHYNYRNQEFDISFEVYYMWKLTTFNLDEVIKVMENVVSEYGGRVVKPEDNCGCILVIFDLEEKTKHETSFLKMAFSHSIEKGATLEKCLEYYAEYIDFLGFKKSMKMYKEALEEVKKMGE